MIVSFTSFNTVRGDYLNEISVEKFFKKIEKGITSYSKFRKLNKDYVDLCYKSNVYKIDDTHYKVSFYKKRNYDEYTIDTSEYPEYSAKLEEYAKITEVNEYEKKCYNEIENGSKKGTKKENIAYFNYLKKLVKCLNKYVFKKVLELIQSNIFLLGMLVCVHNGMAVATGAFAFLWINSMVHTSSLFDDPDMITLPWAEHHEIRKRKKNVQKVFGNEKNLETVIEYDNNDDKKKEKMYSNNIVKYMNTIMLAASKLKPDDKKAVLAELRTIYGEYESRCMELSDNKNKGLTLDSGEPSIMMNTIKKLSDLHMEVSDMLKRDENIRELLADGDEFKEQLDNNIKEIEEGKKRTLSRGR